jgi:catechol 2,3-dioxygenase-like lactoylglutathione lyase family enzyme
MITKLTHVTIYVLDQDSAKDFYVNKLGFELRNDITMGEEFDGSGEGLRWLTVGSPSQPDVEYILADCRMGHSPENAAELRDLVAKGGLGPGVFATDDCHKTYAELTERGVTFLSEPSERPYGVEAVFRDDSGNWFSLTQAKYLDQAK